MLYCKLDTIEKVKSALEFWGRPEVFEELTAEEWLVVPYYLYFEGDELLVTDFVSREDLAVSFEQLKADISPIKANRKFLGYVGMPREYYALVGSNFFVQYLFEGNYHTEGGRKFPQDSCGVSKRCDYKRGDIFELVNPFGDLQLLKEVFDLPSDTTQVVATRSDTDEDRVCYQIRGGKQGGSIPMVFLRHIGSRVSFKPKTIKTETCEIDCTEVYRKVRDFYSDKGTSISTSFKGVVSSSIESKVKYLPFLFRDGINLNLSKDETFRQKCIRLHPRYNEMIEVLKELGIDTVAQKENIFNNTLVIEGAKKPKTVTGFIQGLKKLRFDNVYSESRNVFESEDQVWISADPYEMVRASEYTNNRSGDLSSSCFRYSGQYHSAVWAYIQSQQTTILKIKDSQGRTAHRMWISFDVDNGAIIFGRIYGRLNDYQQKVIRYTIEQKFADFLDLPNSWGIFSRDDVSVEYNSDNTYWDTPSRVMFLKALGTSSVELELGEALDSDCDESSNGEFRSGTICEYCDDRVDEDDTYYVDGYGQICEHCLNEHFRTDIHGNYIHQDYANYVEDIEEYVHDNELSDYLMVDGSYYAEMPDGWVDTEDNGICEEEDCFYDDVEGVWYSTRQKDYMNTLYDRGYVHNDNVTDDMYWCSECSHYHEDSEKCPVCGEKVED